VTIELERLNLRERLPDLAPTSVANMTAPVLHQVAELLCGERDRGEVRGSLPSVAPLDLTPVPPTTLVCSGLLLAEVEGVAEAFAPAGLAEVERRADGDWAALLLRSA
jgi:ribosomal protein L11 methylase PrmA